MTTLRKRRLKRPAEPEGDSAPLNLASVACIDYSSEDPAHRVEHLIDERTGPGGSSGRRRRPIPPSGSYSCSMSRRPSRVSCTKSRRRSASARRRCTSRPRRTRAAATRSVLVQEYTFSPRRVDLPAGRSAPRSPQPHTAAAHRGTEQAGCRDFQYRHRATDARYWFCRSNIVDVGARQVRGIPFCSEPI